MKIKTSRQIFAHIDCDSFFASCEIFRNPALEKKCVCVWGEIVVAACYNSKALWVKTWTPVWEAKRILGPKGVFISPDMEYYGKISKRIMSFISLETENIEIFSVDEAFCEITWLAEMNHMSIYEFADNLKKRIKQEIGIPVSIGVSNTRIKAKMFSKVNKPYGTCVWIDKTQEEELLKNYNIKDVPFIGKATEKRLKFIYPSAFDFKNSSYFDICKSLGKNWGKLWMEINGVNSMNFFPKVEAKSITRSRAFNKDMTSSKEIIWARLLKNIDRLMQELIIEKYEIANISIFLIDKNWQLYRFSAELNEFTNERSKILEVSKILYDKLYIPWTTYRKTGLVCSKLQAIKEIQMSLFEARKSKSKLELLVLEQNKKYNKEVLKIGAF